MMPRNYVAAVASHLFDTVYSKEFKAEILCRF